MTHWHKFPGPQINRLPTFQRRFSPNTSKLRNCEIRTSFIFKARVSNKSHQSFPIFFRLKQRASERAPRNTRIFRNSNFLPPLPSPRNTCTPPLALGVEEKKQQRRRTRPRIRGIGTKKISLEIFERKREKHLLWPMCTLFIHE